MIGQRVLVTALGESDVPLSMRVGEVYTVAAEGRSILTGDSYVVLEGHPSYALSSRCGDRWMVDPATEMVEPERRYCDMHIAVALPCYWCCDAERRQDAQ